MSCMAGIIERFSAEYIAAAEFKIIPVAALKELLETARLIKIFPADAGVLCSDFKTVGFPQGCIFADSRNSF